jgi:hypothetical protein
MLLILLVVLALFSAASNVLYVFRIKDARNHIEFLSDAQAEAQDLRIDAERRAEAANTELNFLRATLQGIISRPAVAVINDDLIQNFASIVDSIVHPETKRN